MFESAEIGHQVDEAAIQARLRVAGAAPESRMA